MGQYGADAYFMFCRGAWRALAPADKDLARYHAWLAATGGEGTGLTRDAATPVVPTDTKANPCPEPRSPGGGAAHDARSCKPLTAFSPGAESARGGSGASGVSAGFGGGSERGCVLARCASRGVREVGRVEWPGGPVGGSPALPPSLQPPRLGSCGAVAAAPAAQGGMPAGVGESVR